MRPFLITAYLSALPLTAAVKQVHKVCWETICNSIVLRDERVKFVSDDSTDPTLHREVDLGVYVPSAGALVLTEAPIRDFVLTNGWRVVFSEAITKEKGPILKIRYYNLKGVLKVLKMLSEDMPGLLSCYFGNLLGESDILVGYTTTWEHAYSVQSSIWLLPDSGDPRLLLEVTGVLSKFIDGEHDVKPGVIVDVESYDGMNPQTKGRTRKMWIWDRGLKAFLKDSLKVSHNRPEIRLMSMQIFDRSDQVGE